MDFRLILLFLAARFIESCSGVPECVASSSGTTFPHESYCDRYYECSQDGSLTEHECDTQGMYSKESGSCHVPISAVDCSDRPYSNRTRKTFLIPQRPECVAGGPVLYHPHENFCDRYYKCDETGHETMGVCPPGMYFDEVDRRPEELKCTVDYSVGSIKIGYFEASFYCLERPFRREQDMGTCDSDSFRKYEAVAEDCRAYKECDREYEGGKPVYIYKSRTCTIGEVFDPSVSKCVIFQSEIELDCDMKNVLQITCPDINEWENYNRNVRPWTVTWEVQYYLDNYYRPGKSDVPFDFGVPIKNTRVPYGHCWWFFECVRDAEGKTKEPQLNGCPGGEALDPNSMHCVPENLVPGCENYYELREKSEDYVFALLAGELPFENAKDFFEF